MKEATQRCKDLGLHYEFVQTQVADEFGLFNAVVKIIDKKNGCHAEWPPARLTVWLNLIRENCDLTAANAFDAVDVQWSDTEEAIEVNESLNSSRISLNLSAMKDAILGTKPIKSRFEALRSKFSPWSDKKQRPPPCNPTAAAEQAEPTQIPKKPIDGPRKALFTEHKLLDDTIDDEPNIEVDTKTSTPTPAVSAADQQAQQHLRDLRKTVLAMKKLFHDQSRNENCTAGQQSAAEKVVSLLEQVEQLSNEMRHVVKNTQSMTTTPQKVTKTVRFAFDAE